jgi:hypothetical protein
VGLLLFSTRGAAGAGLEGEPGDGRVAELGRLDDAVARDADEEGEAAEEADAEDEDEDAADDDDDDIRERLTERPDRRRPAEPFELDVFGRPLTLGGEYDVSIFHLEQMAPGDPDEQGGRMLLGSELGLEAFYSFGDALSLFGQVSLGLERDLDSSTPSDDSVSTSYIERGELWLYSEGVLAEGLSFEIGSLYYQDDRHWWWDADLDGVRVNWERETFEVSLSAASEQAPRNSAQSFIDPEEEDVSRFLGDLHWDYLGDHSVELFALHQNDDSEQEAPGEIVDDDREDPWDGDFTWVGGRLSGAWDPDGWGLLGYWVDAAYVFGETSFVEYEEAGNDSRVVEVLDQRVRGWGGDVGATWILPFPLEPRLTLGYALGSGDRNPDGETDHSFRQTSLQSNESAFGAARTFAAYGAYLNPELSNLQIVTAGGGISLFSSSSLDLMYHSYRQLEPVESLFDSNLDEVLTGESRDIGHGIDLILSIRESTWIEPYLDLSAFYTGAAFGPDRGEWLFGFTAGLTVVF